MNDSLTFETTDVPEKAFTVARKPNPFHEPVKALADSAGEDGRSASAVTFTVPQDKEKAMVTKAQDAGKELGVTVRKSIEVIDADTDAPQSRITIWTIPRVTRVRKAKPADDGGKAKSSK